ILVDYLTRLHGVPVENTISQTDEEWLQDAAGLCLEAGLKLTESKAGVLYIKINASTHIIKLTGGTDEVKVLSISVEDKCKKEMEKEDPLLLAIIEHAVEDGKNILLNNKEDFVSFFSDVSKNPDILNRVKNTEQISRIMCTAAGDWGSCASALAVYGKETVYTEEECELLQVFLSAFSNLYKLREKVIHEKTPGLLESLPIAQLKISPDGKILYANPHTQVWTGLSKENIIGKNIYEIICPESREDLERVILTSKQNPASAHAELIFHSCSGEHHYIYLKAMYLKNASEDEGVIHCIMINIDEFAKIETSLRNSEEKFRSIVEGVNDIIYFLNPELVITYMSSAVEKLYGLCVSEIVGKHIAALIHPDDYAELIKIIEEAKSGISKKAEFRLRYGNWSIWVTTTLKPVIEKGELAGFVGVFIDVDKEHKAFEALNEREEILRTICENLNVDAVFSISEEGIVDYITPSILNITGYSDKEIIGKSFFDFVAPEQRDKFIELTEKRHSVNEFTNFEFTYIDRHGASHWLRTSTKDVYKDGKLVGRKGIISDITHLKQTEDKLKKELEEKQVLIKEVHHRVKNNLQVIVSLLNMQSRSVKDPYDQMLFQDSINRVKSLALVHEKLYQSPDLKNIDFKDYITKLCNHLLSIYRDKVSKVRLDLKIEKINVDINKAIPLGLMLNEILSNSLKYAFPQNQPGFVFVWMYLQEGSVVVEAGDDGVGLPEGFDPSKSKSLGMQLLASLPAQLGGTLTRESADKGVRYKITFPINNQNNDTISRK
ncbi:MAG: PAS domain S-box protein, partial [Thermoplasmata archaeon]